MHTPKISDLSHIYQYTRKNVTTKENVFFLNPAATKSALLTGIRQILHVPLPAYMYVYDEEVWETYNKVTS